MILIRYWTELKITGSMSALAAQLRQWRRRWNQGPTPVPILEVIKTFAELLRPRVKSWRIQGDYTPVVKTMAVSPPTSSTATSTPETGAQAS